MDSLEGHFLIAMPGMGDPNFNEAVAFVCKHNDDGALGIVVNRASDMQLGEIFSQLELEVDSNNTAEQPVMNGGPVQPDRGFVLHQSEQSFDSTVDPAASVKVTVSQDILKTMAKGDGPSPALVALGYAGWSAGQLESELAANAWLSTPADPSVIFSTPISERWAAAAALLGVDIRQLTNYAGHA
jgi:putative transcriptional regulator